MSAIAARFGRTDRRDDDQRDRHVAERADEIAERADQRVDERLLAVNADGVGKGRKVVLHQPDDMRRRARRPPAAIVIHGAAERK